MKISCSMIMKNEEDQLDRSLSSIVNHVDEIVIYDTGSTDKSIEIAIRYGARIFIEDWKSDFSYHRNQSIKKCTGDWIIILDCDEKFICNVNLKKKLKKLSNEIKGIRLQINDLNDNDNIQNQWQQLRIFKNGSTYFKNSVHNRSVISGKYIDIADRNLTINHYGYQDDIIKKKNKNERLINMLYKRLEKDNSAETHYYLMNALIGDKQYKKGIAHGNISLSILDGATLDDTIYASIHHALVHASLCLAEAAEAVKYLNDGLSKMPNNIDLNLDKATIFNMTKQYDKRNEYAIKYLKLIEDYEKNKSRFSNQFNLSVGRQYINQCKQWIKET